MRDALQRLPSEAEHSLEPRAPETLEEQVLAADCVFPLVTGSTGPLMRDLLGGGAQHFLDEEDGDRASDSR